MRMAKLIVAGILILASLGHWTTVQAASGGTVLHVQADIRPWLKLSADQPTTSYQVTAEDIRRGHIDLPGALTISMQTNIREEISVDISSEGPGRVMVRNGQGLGSEVNLKGDHPSVPVRREVDMRVILYPGTEEGTYPLLVALAPRAY